MARRTIFSIKILPEIKSVIETGHLNCGSMPETEFVEADQWPKKGVWCSASEAKPRGFQSSLWLHNNMIQHRSLKHVFCVSFCLSCVVQDWILCVESSILSLIYALVSERNDD